MYTCRYMHVYTLQNWSNTAFIHDDHNLTRSTSTKKYVMSVVQEFGVCSRDFFQSAIYQLNKPALLKNIDLGAAVSLWDSPDYLIARCRDKQVKVHVSPTLRMDFIGKNFIYR